MLSFILQLCILRIYYQSYKQIFYLFMCDMKKITNTEFISCILRLWFNKLFIRAVVVLTDINITVAIQFIDLVLEIWSVVKLLTYIGDVPLHLVFTV